MTLDEIITAFRTSDLPPEATLRAAVPLAGELAPRIYALGERFCRGICLATADEREYLYGLHVLAAARHPDLWTQLVALARCPDDELDHLFDLRAPTCLASLMATAWDGDVDGLLRLIQHADMGHNGKWALFDALARLTFDGRISRETTAAFLERFEREGLADDDSEVWWGWDSAVSSLGIRELEGALLRAWTKPAYAGFDDRTRQETIDDLHAAAASPTDPVIFDEAGICPITDPVAALNWMHLRAATRQRIAEDMRHVRPDAFRPATDDLNWLGRFLTCRQVPPTTMPLAMLDGYLTALAIGPGPIRRIEHFAHIWGEDPGTSPNWENEAQCTRVMGLIEDLAEEIAVRRRNHDLHTPLLSRGAPEYAIASAADWAEGFAFGIDLEDASWAPLFDDRHGAEDTLAVIALCENETEYFGRPATTKERLQIIDRLPVILQRIAAFWDDPSKGYPRPQPIKADKIGRNDPCPCGSGKKYKKCCGA